MEQRRAPGGRSGPVALTSLALTAFLALCVPAADAVTVAGPDPNNDDMGSQIERNEGGDQSLPLPSPDASVPGIDVSNHQPQVNWAGHAAAGKRFAYIKATEGTNYVSPAFPGQYQGASKAGLLRGAYHFALPDKSSGAEQANYFVDHGGGWSPDGKTLPGALDMEYNPYGDTCYRLAPGALAAWIKDFSDTYQRRTTRTPIIYTSTKWFNKCVQDKYKGRNPLWVARYNNTIGELPKHWTRHTIWQHSSKPIDQDLFNGGEDGLKRLARGK